MRSCPAVQRNRWVSFQYERPGAFADTLKAYRSELTRQGWIETYNERGSRIYFCRTPYRLELAKSGSMDERVDGFSVWLAWHRLQMDRPCR